MLGYIVNQAILYFAFGVTNMGNPLYSDSHSGTSLWKKFCQFIKENPHAWLALLLPMYLILFFAVERYISPDKPYWASYVPLDDQIPFLEGFILPYCMWYPFLVAVGLYLLIRDGNGFRRYMAFIMTGFCTALLFCVLVPNGQDLRPTEFPQENFCTWLVTQIYAADTNTNVFPSMHVIGSIGAVFAVFKCPSLRSWRWPSVLLCFFICISTVFVKQHSILDIFGGLAWCVPLWFFIYFLPNKRNK